MKERTAWTVFSASGTAASALQRGHPERLRVGLCHPLVKSLTAEHEHEPVVSDGIHGHIDVRTSIRSSSSTNGTLLTCGDSSCPSIDQQAGFVEVAKIPSRRNLAVPQFNADADGFQDAPPYEVLDRVVAEQG